MSDVLSIKKITQFEASNWMWCNRNQPPRDFLVEPHHQMLNQPDAKQNLYKVIKKEYFDDMVKNNYLYFNRVDTYEDDKADGEQLPLDRPQNRNYNLVMVLEFTRTVSGGPLQQKIIMIRQDQYHTHVVCRWNF